jgi:hypothetical protein
VADKRQEIRLALPTSGVAAELRGLVQHRAELVRESTRRKNKLTGICDQLFPEFTQVFKNPNGETALAIRAKYPTPHAIAIAALSELCALRMGHRPSKTDLARLQDLAAQTIGVHDVVRERGLAFEQSQLIREQMLLQEHLEQLDAQIEQIVARSREGCILGSVPGIGAASSTRRRPRVSA